MPVFVGSKSLQSQSLPSLLFVVAVLFFNNDVAHYVDSAPTIIDSGTLEKAKGSATLGAGYTITNNAFYSSCLDFNDLNIVSPQSYNHEYYFTDIVNRQGKDIQTVLSGRISKTFGYSSIKTAIVDAAQASTDSVIIGNVNDGYTDFSKYAGDSTTQNTKAATGNIDITGTTITEPHAGEWTSETVTATASVQRYNAVATMRTEHFASRLKQTLLSLNAIELLQNQNYVGYFTSCGANYVRSIRRAQEVSALFTFDSVKPDVAQAFSADLGTVVSASGSSDNTTSLLVETMYQNSAYAPLLASMKIDIFAYGMSFHQDAEGGSSSIVATSLRTFNDAMRAAYKAMTKEPTTEDGTRFLGMISHVEVVPWVDEAEFLNFAGIEGNSILVPKPRMFIANAVVDAAAASGYRCTLPNLEADDFGKCCDASEMAYLPGTDESDGGDGNQKRKCDPQENLSIAVMRDNLETNAEFVAMLDSLIRNKIQSISTLSQCVTTLRTFSEEYDYHFVRSMSNTKFDASLETSFTLKEIKVALDNSGDLEIVSMVSGEVDEYMEMFYEQCLGALYGMNIGTSSDTDPKFFMAQPWYNHKECTRKSCLERNMAWDRKTGTGCVRGLVGRVGTESLPSSSDTFCSKQWNETTGQDYCKYSPDPEYIKQMDTCRGRLPQGKDGKGKSIPLSMSKLMDYFCMPNLDVENGQADLSKIKLADQTEYICSSQSIPTLEPSANPPSPSPSVDTTDDYPYEPTDDYPYEPTDDYPYEPTNDYHDCPVLSTFGDLINNGNCDYQTNLETCGFDGGDCLDKNKEIQSKYPDCNKVQYSPFIGNGDCQFETNLKECGYDGDDCLEINGKIQSDYPDCNRVQYSPFVGNGDCQFELNLEVCGYDGGDCEDVNAAFVNKYRECRDKIQYSVRFNDGKCDDVLNIARCGYDGDDCNTDNNTYKSDPEN